MGEERKEEEGNSFFLFFLSKKRGKKRVRQKTRENRPDPKEKEKRLNLPQRSQFYIQAANGEQEDTRRWFRTTQ